MSSCSLFRVGCHAFGIGHSPFRKLPQLDAKSVKHLLSGIKKLLLKLNSWFSVLAATCELGKQAVAYGLQGIKVLRFCRMVLFHEVVLFPQKSICLLASEFFNVGAQFALGLFCTARQHAVALQKFISRGRTGAPKGVTYFFWPRRCSNGTSVLTNSNVLFCLGTKWNKTSETGSLLVAKI